jgi:hypothetical protein
MLSHHSELDRSNNNSGTSTPIHSDKSPPFMGMDDKDEEESDEEGLSSPGSSKKSRLTPQKAASPLVIQWYVCNDTVFRWLFGCRYMGPEFGVPV